MRHLLLACALCLAVCAWADGAYFGPESAHAYSADQHAAILWDPDTGIERMLLATQYAGPLGAYAWVVPVPTLPTREQVRAREDAMQVLWDLDTRSAPRVFYDDGYSGIGCCMPMGAAGAGDDSANAVTVADRFQTGAYDIALLGATGGAQLEAWLTGNGFRVPDGAAATLQYYTDRGWGFVAARIPSPGGAPDAVRAFPYTGLEITFATQTPVFPLRISAISTEAGTTSDIVLHVLAPQRMVVSNLPCSPFVLKPEDFSGGRSVFRERYEAAFARQQTEAGGAAVLEEYSLRASYTSMPDSWLHDLGYQSTPLIHTRLHTRLTREQMTEDLFLVPAEASRPPVDHVLRLAQARRHGPDLALALALALAVSLGAYRSGRASPRAAGTVGLFLTLLLLAVLW